MVDDAGMDLLARAVRRADLDAVSTMIRLGARACFHMHLRESIRMNDVDIAEVLLSGCELLDILVRNAEVAGMLRRHTHLCHVVMCLGVPATHGVLVEGMGEDEELLGLLLQGGITTENPRTRGLFETALECSVPCLELLLHAGLADPGDRLAVVANFHGCAEGLVSLIEHGFAPNTWKTFFGSALQIALGTPCLPLVEFVLASGVDPSDLGCDAWTGHKINVLNTELGADALRLVLEYGAQERSPGEVGCLRLPDTSDPDEREDFVMALRPMLDFGAVTPVIPRSSEAQHHFWAPLWQILHCHLCNHVTDTETHIFLPSSWS